MSVNSISGASPALVGSTGSMGQKNQRALWAQVGQDLNSNDLAGAQSAFATLKKNYEANVAAGTAPPPGNGPVWSDIDQLGSALKSGSLSGAQAAFGTLQQAVAALGGGSGAQSNSTDSATAALAGSLNVLA